MNDIETCRTYPRNPTDVLWWVSCMLFLVCCIPILGVAGERSRFGEIANADWQEIKQTISLQLAAFERDDHVAAFSYASISIKRQFVTAENFLALVRAAYPAIYRPRAVEFLGHHIRRGFPYQRVQVVAPDGAVFEAQYKMLREHDQIWKIDGCVLKPTNATST